MKAPLQFHLVMDAQDFQETQDVQAMIDERLKDWKLALERQGDLGEIFLSMSESLTQFGKVNVYAEVRKPEKIADVIPITRAPSFRK